MDLSLVHPLSDRVRANAFLSKQRSVVRYSPSPLRRAVIVAGDVVRPRYRLAGNRSGDAPPEVACPPPS